MKKYKVYYQLGDQLGIGEDWQQKISAETPEQAYREFVKKVGAFPRAVNVETGLFGDIDVFEDHVASAMEKQRELAEKKKKIEEEKEVIVAKESFNEQITEITEKQGLNKPESSTEKLLIKIIDLQQNQFDELKKLNYKLWSFWIFFIGLPILAWIIIAANS